MNHIIKMFIWVIFIDIFFMATWGMLRAIIAVIATIGIGVVGAILSWLQCYKSGMPPPFTLLDKKYMSYAGVVRAAVMATNCEFNPRNLTHKEADLVRQNAQAFTEEDVAPATR